MSKLYAYQMVGDGLVLLTPLGEGSIDNTLPGPGRPVDPGYGRPGWRPVDPGYGRPIFHPGHPDHGLPSAPGIPDNSLPSTPPPVVLPGWTLVLVRGSDGKWKYATVAPSSPPPKPVPEPIPPGGAPDNGLPPQPVAPDNTLPPTAQPKK